MDPAPPIVPPKDADRSGWLPRPPRTLRAKMLAAMGAGSILPAAVVYGWLAFYAASSFRQEALLALDAAADRATNLVGGAGGRTEGRPLAEADLRELSAKIGAIAPGPAGFVCLIDDRGDVVAGADAARRGGVSLGFLASLPSPGTGEIRDAQGRRWLVSVGIPAGGVRAAAVEPKRDVAARTFRFCLRTALGMLPLLLAILGVSAWFLSSVLAPVRELTEAAERLKEGRWDARVAVRRRDELGALGRAFNEMAVRLGDQYALVEQEVARRIAQFSTENAERRQAEESLRLKQDELEAMNEASPLGIFAADAAGLCTYANHLLQEIFDGTVLGSSWIARIHPDDRAAVVGRWEGAVREERMFESVHRLLLRDGRVRWIGVKAAPMRRGTKRAGYVGTIEDITERKRAEQRLVAQSRLTRALGLARRFEEAQGEVLQVLRETGPWDLCVVWRVDAAARQLAFSGMEGSLPIPGWKMGQHKRASRFAPGEGHLGRAWLSREPVWIPDAARDPDPALGEMAGWGVWCALALPMVLGDEVVGVIGLYAQREVALDGELLNVLGAWTSEVVQFIARVEAERRRSAMEVELRHAQKMESIGRLAAGIAHEINTPTQFISDNTRFLRDSFGDLQSLLTKYDVLLQAAKRGEATSGLVAEVEEAVAAADLAYLEEEVPKAIGQSIDGLERVSRIVLAMKTFSHPGSQEKSRVDLNRAIESTIIVASNEWKYVAELRTDFDPDLPPVPCFPDEINQVVLNLLVNAVHAIVDVVGNTGSKGRITVRTRAVGGQAEIAVSDTGTGIPEACREKVFDPFFTTKEVGKGTGQGLAIAHAVVREKHGGTISFETETGRGTTFLIRLPLG